MSQQDPTVPSSTPPAPQTPCYDVTPFERWEAVTLQGEHVGFLHRILADLVLTTRMAFQPTGGQRRERADLPVRYLAQSRIRFAPDGSTWTVCDFEDSSSTQNVRIERERAGLAADVVPSWAEHLLLTVADDDGALAEYVRLEEASPLQGPVRMPRAWRRHAGAEHPPVSAASAATGQHPADRPDGPSGTAEHADAQRVEIVSEGHILAVHWVRPNAQGGRDVVASDWGGGTVSVPVATQAQALAGQPADLHTFAQLPTG